MLPVNVLLTPQVLATPFCETRLGRGVSLAVIERLRNVVPPGQGVSVAVTAPAGAATAGGSVPGGAAARAGGAVNSLHPATSSKKAASTPSSHRKRWIMIALLTSV